MEHFINDISIYYEEYGEGIPVLCIHGYGVDHHVMTGCLEPIFTATSGYRRIYPDLPGMGKTAAVGWVNNADTMLQLVKEFIHNIIKSENFLLVGESYGGYLSLGLVREMKEQILGIFLICPVVIADQNKRVLPARSVIWKDEYGFEQYKDDDALEEYLKTAVVAMPAMFERYKADVLPGVTAGNKKFLSLFSKTGYEFSFSDKLRALEFDRPACILIGRQDDIIGYLDPMMLLTRFTRSTVAVLDSAGHNLQIESESLFEAHVNDWLWRIEVSQDLIDTEPDTQICANCGYQDAVFDVRLSARNKEEIYTCENCRSSYSSDEKTLDLKFFKGKKMDWMEYFKTKLTFPFSCVISEYQEKGALHQGDELIARGVEDEDDFYGILLYTTKGKKKYVIPACDLKAKDGEGKNAVIMRNYAVWFANCR